MREILFRGKLNNGSWAYGNLEVKTDGICIITPDDTPIGSYGQVIAETVGQYTGLTDKNGKKIFEGDIVKIVDFQMGVVVQEGGTFGIGINPSIDWDYLDSEICTITGCENRPYFCRNDNFCSFWELMWNYNQEENSCCVVEIIGNIHDTPELLKGGEDNA